MMKQCYIDWVRPDVKSDNGVFYYIKAIQEKEGVLINNDTETYRIIGFLRCYSDDEDRQNIYWYFNIKKRDSKDTDNIPESEKYLRLCYLETQLNKDLSKRGYQLMN